MAWYSLDLNFNLPLMTRRHIDFGWVKSSLIGSIVAAFVASLIVIQLPLVMIQFSVGGLILWIIWGPKPKQSVMSPVKIMVSGGMTTLISMFVGASGPLVGGLFYRSGGKKLTMASALSCQHFLKVVVFIFVGFAFSDWLPPVLAMIASGMLGIWIGFHVLHKIPSDLFNTCCLESRLLALQI